MIPKIIHYCWFGGKEKPKLAQKCITSWKEYCSDFEIIEWNESNFDVHMNAYTEMCFREHKWAFLSDYARLYVVCRYGGIYFDTDVELVRRLDELLNNKAFFGFENQEYVASGLGFGSVANGIAITAMLNEYQELLSGENGTIGCPILNTRALVRLGLEQNGLRQTVADAEIFPIDWFNPYEDATGRLKKTKNTVSIHWYMKSAMSKKTILKSKFTRPLHRLFGVDAFKGIRR